MAFRTVLALAGLVSGLGVAGGCGGGGDSQLDVLELEQLASFVAPGGTVEPVEEGGEGEISRVFAYDDTTAAETGRKAAIDAASASGWTVTFDEDEPGDPIFGAKELATGRSRSSSGSTRRATSSRSPSAWSTDRARTAGQGNSTRRATPQAT